jgi:hypothetical protein
MSNVEEYLTADRDGYDDEYGEKLDAPLAVPDRKHTVYGLPDHIEGERVHIRTPRDCLGTFPGGDYKQTIRDNAPARNYEWLMIEMREGGRVKGTPKVIHLRPRVETVELAAGARPNYQRPHYRRPLHRSHARRESQDKSADLLRHLIEKQEKQHAAELARAEQYDREMRELERKHQEDTRRLEREINEERFKRLEEKASESRTKPEENPAGFDFKSIVGHAAVKAIEHGKDDLANTLIGTLKQEEEDAGSFWGFARGVAGDVIEAVRENPQSISQAAQALAPVLNMFRGGAAMSPPPQPGSQPPPQSTAAQPQPPSDLEVLTALSQEIAAAVVGDSDPAGVARMVRDVLAERPHMRPTIEQTFRQSDEELLASLAAMAGVSFEGLGRKPFKWAKDFRRALIAYRVNAEPQTEIDSAQALNNGNMGAASAVAQ